MKMKLCAKQCFKGTEYKGLQYMGIGIVFRRNLFRIKARMHSCMAACNHAIMQSYFLKLRRIFQIDSNFIHLFKKHIRILLYLYTLITIYLSFLVPANVSFAQESESGIPPNSDNIIPALNFKDTDIRDVLRSIAFEYETNVVIDKDLNIRISVALFNITVFDAIEIIAKDNGCNFRFDSKRFFVEQIKPEQPPPPPKPEEILNISYSNGNINIEAENIPIQTFLEELIAKTDKNYLLSTGTSGRISGLLKDMELETALKNLLQNNGFYLTSKDSIYYITRSAYFSSNEISNDGSTSPYWVSAQGNRITMDVNQVNLDRIINDISNQLGLQIIKLTKPEANITMNCSDVTVDKLLEYLFKGTEYSYKEDEGIYIIGKKENKVLENTKLVKLNHLRADKVKESLPPNLMQKLTANVSIEHNALILTGSNEDIAGLTEYIKEIDQPVPQVFIEAVVIDYNLDNTFQFGLSAGKGDSTKLFRIDKFYPGLDMTAGGNKVNEILKGIGEINLFGNELDLSKIAKLPSDFYVNLRMLEENGIVNIKSRPILSTLNGHTASLKIGTQQNYVFKEVVPLTSVTGTTYIEKETIQKIEANISFEITPWVGPNNELTLEIKPDFQTPVGQFTPDKNYIPAINTRTLTSTVRLKEGETIILGGLIQDSEINSEEKFPFLGDIPILGELFTNTDRKKTRGELLIYLTPKIFYGDDLGHLAFNYAHD